MYSSTKFLARILICLILGISIYFIIDFKVELAQNLRATIIEPQAKAILNQYVSQVFSNNQSIVSQFSNKSITELRLLPNFANFTSNSTNFFKDLPPLKLTIYNLHQEIIFTSNDIFFDDMDLNKNIKQYLYNKINLFSFKTIDKAIALQQVLNAPNYSQFLTNISYEQVEKFENRTLIQIFIPIKSQNKIDAIAEIFYDITEFWHQLEHMQTLSLIGAILLFLTFLIILFLVSTKLEAHIQNQHEINVELAEAKANAEQDNSEKSKFLANISHELRSPLNAIIGFSEIIKSEALGPLGNMQYKDYINDIYNSGTHLLSLINDILDYSKAKAEKLKIESIEVDITKLLHSTLKLVEPRAMEAKVNLIEQIPAESIIMIGDPKRLKQAILNLLSNSVKFTPENGNVYLSMSLNNDLSTLIIEVKDTGIGISDQDIAKVMSGFGQIDSKLSRRYEGTGLGLPLTKTLVELMKGTFSIRSEPNFGTIVTITFPYAKEAVTAA